MALLHMAKRDFISHAVSQPSAVAHHSHAIHLVIVHLKLY
jgi:hypothetical protein